MTSSLLHEHVLMITVDEKRLLIGFLNVLTDEKVEVVAIPKITNNKPKPLDKTDEEKADELDSNARLAEAMKLQAEMQEAKLQALKVANKSRQTAAIQVKKNFVRSGIRTHASNGDQKPR